MTTATMNNVQSQQDTNADKAITTMIAAMTGAAVIPAHVNWALAATAMGSGVVAIGLAYGVKLTKDEGWKLVKQFILGAGLTFVGLAVGSKIIAMLLSSTGIGHLGAVALDATVSAAIGYAVGETAKEYFRRNGNVSKAELRRIFRNTYNSKKEG